MIRYIILAQREVTAKALVKYLELADMHACQKGGEEYKVLVWENASNVSDFCRIADRMEAYVKGENGTIPRNQVTVLVDSVKLSLLNPIGGNGWETIIAMLVLAFPELRWYFGNILRNSLHSLASMAWAQSDPLFDGDGLREHVRERARQSKGNDAGFIPKRKKLAIALDDETSYGYFHAYAAYRFGFRTHAVVSERLALDLLRKEDKRKKDRISNGELGLSIEDLYLNFPDHSPSNLGKASTADQKGNKEEIHLSNLIHRGEALPGLDENPKSLRVFVTTGQRRQGDGDKWESNRQFRRDLRGAGRLGTMVYKPTAGIFSLWEESRLMRKLRGGRTGRLRGYAEGFEPWEDTNEGAFTGSGGHSAPGKLLEVASRLINRAEAIYRNASTVEDAVQGAVLATDALELLGGRTPTSALEALALKHQLEVTAGCLFYGTQFNLLVRPRLRELRRDIHRIGKWFNRKRRTQSEMNAELGIVSELAGIFRHYTEFDEERVCLNRIRALCRGLWVRKYPWQAFMYPLRWYVDFLMGSLARLTGAIAVWAAGLLSFFYYCEPKTACPEHSPFQNAVVGTLTSFFQAGPASEFSGGLPLLVSTFAILFGFIHLGIFISHLYTIASRR